MAEDLRAAESSLTPFEASFAADTSYRPDLDLPLEATVATTQSGLPGAQAHDPPRGPDGRFLPRAGEPQTYQHSRAISQLAQDLGFSAQEIAATHPDVLEDRVYHLNRQQLRFQQDQRALVGNGIRPPDAPAAKQAEPEAEINWDDYDPKLAAYLKAKDQEIKQLKGELTQQKVQREQSAEEQRLDGLFADLGDPELFGKGGARDQDVNGEPFSRRRAVVAEAQRLGAVNRANLTRAKARLFGAGRSAGQEQGQGAYAPREPAGQQRPVSELDQRKQDWDEGRLATPSHRRPTPPSPDTRAAQVVRERMMQYPDAWSDREEP